MNNQLSKAVAYECGLSDRWMIHSDVRLSTSSHSSVATTGSRECGPNGSPSRATVESILSVIAMQNGLMSHYWYSITVERVRRSRPMYQCRKPFCLNIQYMITELYDVLLVHLSYFRESWHCQFSIIDATRQGRVKYVCSQNRLLIFPYVFTQSRRHIANI